MSFSLVAIVRIAEDIDLPQHGRHFRADADADADPGGRPRRCEASIRVTTARSVSSVECSGTICHYSKKLATSSTPAETVMLRRVPTPHHIDKVEGL